MKFETISIHAGNQTDPATGAVIEPLTLSTTFERAADGSYPAGYAYIRAGNPNRNSLEKVLARLENGADACAFASGNAAANAIFQSLAPGSHLIAPTDMYHGLRNLLNQVYVGILEVDFMDMADIASVEKTIRPDTRLIWLETPSNPLLKISDIASIATLARKKGVSVCCDNTFATPVFQRPLDLGAELVMHSTTKYISGHSDVMGGALITKVKNEQWEKIRSIQELSGAVPSPFDCYMTVRGIKTLAYRMRGHVENARKIAMFLENNPMIEKVNYPGLKTNEQYAVAEKQMSDFGGMLSFQVRGGEDNARKLVNALQIFTQATSLGGVESLVEHRASIEGPDSKTPKNLLRLSVGLENIEDLIEDLSLAISKL